MSITLTIVTPTFNRAYCLGRCLESLNRQTSKDFLWLIIDDGSTDNTSEMVKAWRSRENAFEIRYYYKENGGIHTALNIAYRMITTELNMCIGSDDYLPDQAVELILKLWAEKKSDQYAGIIGLDIDQNGCIIGTELPDVKDMHLLKYYRKGGRGDKKLIYRTDVVNQYPDLPVFDGEKFFTEAYKFRLIDHDYSLLILNKPICIVEYLADGLSKNMYRLYVQNPKGFAFLKRMSMKYEKNILYNIKFNIQYVAFSFLAKDKYFITNSPLKIMTVLTIPFGLALYLFILYKIR